MMPLLWQKSRAWIQLAAGTLTPVPNLDICYLQELVNVESDIVVDELRVQTSEVCIVNVLKDE